MLESLGADLKQTQEGGFFFFCAEMLRAQIATLKHIFYTSAATSRVPNKQLMIYPLICKALWITNVLYK